MAKMHTSIRIDLNAIERAIGMRWIGALLIFVAATLALHATESRATDSVSSQLVGAWKMYRDDDRPEGPVPNEIMNFWPNGKFLIAGNHRHEGLYRIDGEQLQLLAKVGDRAIPIQRNFQLSGEELKFKNQKSGWAYYKRVSRQPQGEEPDL